jgi:glycosyltransferase involved in cell wall biosynthesis
MKICLFSLNANHGAGLGRMVLSIAEEFINRGHSVGFVYEKGDFLGDFLIINYMTKNPIQIVKNIFNVCKFISKYDYLICYDIKPAGIYVLISSMILRKKYFLHCIGTYSLPTPNDSILKRFILNRVYLNSQKTFMLSSVVKKEFQKRTLCNTGGAIILPPGVTQNFSFFEKKTTQLQLDEKYIISVGEIKSRKGHDLSVKAFSSILKKYPNLKYVLVGQKNDNPFTRSLDDYIKKNGLHEHVIFLQDVKDEDLSQLYKDAEFFVMSSITTENFIEGFGIVYLEAALAGIPSIGCFGTGAEDAIIDMVTGKLCNQTIDSIADAMDILLSNEQLRLEMSKNAQKRAQKFTWGSVIGEYENHFA